MPITVRGLGRRLMFRDNGNDEPCDVWPYRLHSPSPRPRVSTSQQRRCIHKVRKPFPRDDCGENSGFGCCRCRCRQSLTPCGLPSTVRVLRSKFSPVSTLVRHGKKPKPGGSGWQEITKDAPRVCTYRATGAILNRASRLVSTLRRHYNSKDHRYKIRVTSPKDTATHRSACYLFCNTSPKCLIATKLSFSTTETLRMELLTSSLS